MNTFDFMQLMLDEAVEAGCFPAACCAVGVGDRPLFSCASGNANIETRFDMASLTKILSTTMLALRALECGELTLHDTVGRFFPDAPEDKRDITIFQLMTHTAGFEPAFLLEDEIGDPLDAAACILRHPLAQKPDGAPRYSCMGFILLGKIMEIITGKRLDHAARDHVFEPLEMTDTCYNPTGVNIAPTEVLIDTGVALCGVVHDENARFLGGVSGNAGVFSNIRNMEKFARMLAVGGGGFLQSRTVLDATRNYTPGYDAHRGLGFHLGGTENNFMGGLFPDASFGHTGFTGTSLVIDPGTGLYAILLTNRVHPTRDNDKLLGFRRAFHDRIYIEFKKILPLLDNVLN